MSFVKAVRDNWDALTPREQEELAVDMARAIQEVEPAMRRSASDFPAWEDALDILQELADA